jgi:hypothetical protein
MIATKYEEIYPPTVKDLVYITDNAYKKEEILQMEQTILIALDFDISQTSPLRFLERMSKVAKADEIHVSLAQYLLELSLLDSKMNQFIPSEQAASSLLIANRMILGSQEKLPGTEQFNWNKLAKNINDHISDGSSEQHIPKIPN